MRQRAAQELERERIRGEALLASTRGTAEREIARLLGLHTEGAELAVDQAARLAELQAAVAEARTRLASAAARPGAPTVAQAATPNH